MWFAFCRNCGEEIELNVTFLHEADNRIYSCQKCGLAQIAEYDEDIDCGEGFIRMNSIHNLSIDIGNILQEVYDEEINLTISWFWDMGIDVIIGDNVNGIKAEYNFDTVREAMSWLSKKIVELYPNSDFAKRRNA